MIYAFDKINNGWGYKLNFSLLDIASIQVVPFKMLQYVQCIRHQLTFAEDLKVTCLLNNKLCINSITTRLWLYTGLGNTSMILNSKILWCTPMKKFGYSLIVYWLVFWYQINFKIVCLSNVGDMQKHAMII